MDRIKEFLKGLKNIQILLLLFLILHGYSLPVCAKEESERAIYIVYDNSYSMVDKDGSWSQAAYAIETLSVMKNEQDRIYLYFMSDDMPYTQIDDNLNNANDAIREEVHDALRNISYTNHTHVDGLKQAIEDIKNDSTEDVWLLVFTDGLFNMQNGIEQEVSVDLKNELPDVKSILFRMGTSGETIKNPEILFDASKEDILSEFTEIGNLIYDRQEIIYQKKRINEQESQVNFELELPAKRIIFMTQSEKEISGSQIVFQGKNLEEVLTESYSSLKVEETKILPEKIREGYKIPNYYAEVKIYESEDLISPGKFNMTIPSNAELAIFVEYEVQYTVCFIDEDGKLWDANDLEAMKELREGNYRVEVKLVNAITGKIIEEADSYKNIETNLYLKNDDEEFYLSNGEEIQLLEGNYELKVSAKLEGNYPQEMEQVIEVKHNLGILDIRNSRQVLDIDHLKEEESYIFISLWEDEENISNLEGLELSLEGDEYHTYQYEKVENGWKVFADVSNEDAGNNILGKFPLTIKIIGEREGQKISEVKKINIEYVATENQLSFEVKQRDLKDVLQFILHNKISVVPLINGQPIKMGKEIENVTGELQDLRGPEGLKADAKLVSGKPMEYRISFKRNAALTKMLNGTSIYGTLLVSMERYGITCSGEYDFLLTFGKLSMIRLITIIILAIFLGHVIWIIFGKLLLQCRFWGMSVRAECITKCGELTGTNGVDVTRCYLKNFFSPFSAYVIIPLEKMKFLGFSSEIPSKLIICRRPGGIFLIKNISDFTECEYVKKDGKTLTKLDRRIDLQNGFSLTLLGQYETILKIYLKG